MFTYFTRDLTVLSKILFLFRHFNALYPWKDNCCNVQSKGSWDAGAANVTSVAECVVHAKACSMANFVSYSKQMNDCSIVVRD
jgi:hypothetical protein